MTLYSQCMGAGIWPLVTPSVPPPPSNGEIDIATAALEKAFKKNPAHGPLRGASVGATVDSRLTPTVPETRRRGPRAETAYELGKPSPHEAAALCAATHGWEHTLRGAGSEPTPARVLEVLADPDWCHDCSPPGPPIHAASLPAFSSSSLPIPSSSHVTFYWILLILSGIRWGYKLKTGLLFWEYRN